MIGTGLPQSSVFIGGLRELLLPPDTARGRGRGPGAQRREQSLEGAEHGPPVVLGLPVGRLPWAGRGGGFTPCKAALSLGPRRQEPVGARGNANSSLPVTLAPGA